MCIVNEQYSVLSALAANPSKAKRCHELAASPFEEHDEMHSWYRDIFMSDRDRILYCKSFLRLSGKTQVYAPSTGDHQRTRLTHTLEVSQIARTIAQTLNLNCDLTEAIALGHDIGHTPFGHAGEQILHEIMSPRSDNNPNAPKNTTIYNLSENDIKNNTYAQLYGFKHNLQSVRCIVEDLESRRNPYGLDLTNYTLWGIMHHSSYKYKKGRVNTENINPSFYDRYGIFCAKSLEAPAWSFEALVVAEADEIAQMHHDLEDALRRKAMTKEKVVSILSKLTDLMDDTDKAIMKELEHEKWTPKEYLINKTSKIIVNTLVTTLISSSRENLFNLLKKYSRIEAKDTKEDIASEAQKAADIILSKNYSDPEISAAIKYDIYGDGIKNNNLELINEFQSIISSAVINTHDVQRSDSKGKYIIKNLFEAYYTNPQQLPDSALKNLYKILKEDNYNFNNSKIKEFKNKDYFNIESDELRSIINDAVAEIRGGNELHSLDKKRDILIMRIICDYIAGMTDNFAISEYEKLYG